jgi:hypothetical protein
LLQSQSIDIATVESTAGPFLGPYHAAVYLVASADGAAMAEAYVVGMVVPQEQPDEEDGMDDDIEALFGDSSDGDVVVPVMTDELVALLAFFETPHREEGTRQFMAAERRLLRPCSWCAPTRRGRWRAWLPRRRRHTWWPAWQRRRRSWLPRRRRLVRRRGRRSSPRRATDAAAHEEMARDHRRWDDGMAAGRRACEMHELATQHRHCRNLAR